MYNSKFKEKLYLDCILLCIFVMFVALICKLAGSTDFDMPMIDSKLNNNKALMIVCYLVLYNINSLLVLNIIIKRKFKRIEYLISIIGISFVYFINSTLNLGYFYFIIDISMLGILVLIFTKEPMLFVETLLVSALNIFYQYLSLIIRELNIAVASELFATSIVFQLDYYMLLCITMLYFKHKEVNIYELVYRLIRWNLAAVTILLTKRRCKEKRIQPSKEAICKKQVETSYVLYLVLLSLFQITLVGTACYFVKNTIFNFLFIFISFVVIRARFGKSYHADTILACTTLSLLIFASATRLSLDIDISLFSSVAVGFIVAFILHIKYYHTYYIKAKSDLTKLPLDELKLQLNYLSDLEINLLYDYWHRDNTTTVEDICAKYGYTSKKIYRTIAKIKIEE